MSRPPYLAALALGWLALGPALGCSFEAPMGGAAFNANSCAVDGDCGVNARCDGTMCVARTVDSALRVVLDVTPLQQANNGTPASFTLSSFDVEDGTMTRSWSIAEPLRVRGRVRYGEAVVASDVTLTLPRLVAGLPSKVVGATVGAANDVTAGHDFEVFVPRAGEYTLRVEPKDTTLPPIERKVEIEAGAELDVDYDGVIEELTVELDGATDERVLVVRAFDAATGARVSSIATVAGQRAKLRFAGEPAGYRLVVRPEGAYDAEGLSTPDNCDQDTPVLPTFSIASRDIEVIDGVARLTLPSVPARVRYRGPIELCDAPNEAEAAPASLPVTLRSTAVLLDEAAAQAGWVAEVATDTAATIADGSGFSFCVEVFPGEYDVIVTPPASQACEIFAERRTISSQDGEMATAPLSRMKRAAVLRGDILSGVMPLASAAVDVQSLGREGVVMLRPQDGTLTGYNRSRQTTTNAMGAFRLPVDRGSYDVTIKPPSGSGYAWYVRRDVTIGSYDEAFTHRIDMSSPVAVDCRISYEAGSRLSLAGAEIAAYAIVTDARGVERAIPIGKAVADDAGRFMLLLPPAVREGWMSY